MIEQLIRKQYLNPEGKLIQNLPNNVEDKSFWLKCYALMVQTRLFDAKAIALQRTGKLGTYPSSLGQEAVSVGIGLAMQKNDVLCPYYRDCGAFFSRDITMQELLLYWGGDERGSCYAKNAHDLPICVPIASQTLHAAGVASALKIKGQKNAALTIVGDGGTSRGDFYESINVAGVWKLPIVYVVHNNQWAISVPTFQQTAAKSFAEKGKAAGIEGVQIDGCDIFAVLSAVNTALDNARQKHEPCIIEAMTYRLGDHTTADDATRYRSHEEVEAHHDKEPLRRLKAFLVDQKLWDENKEKTLHDQLIQQINQAVEGYLNTPKRSPESMFTHMYKNPPKAFDAQIEELKSCLPSQS